MQKFEFLRQPLLGELAMSRKKREERERERKRKNAIYSGHLGLCQQPRAAHALRSDQLTCLSYVPHTQCSGATATGNFSHILTSYILWRYPYIPNSEIHLVLQLSSVFQDAIHVEDAFHETSIAVFSAT